MEPTNEKKLVRNGVSSVHLGYHDNEIVASHMPKGREQGQQQSVGQGTPEEKNLMYWETDPRGAMVKAALKAEGAQEILQALQESLLPGCSGLV